MKYLRENDDVYKAVCEFIYSFIKDKYLRLGINPKNDDTNEDIKMRATVLMYMARINTHLREPCTNLNSEIDKLYEDILNNPNKNNVPNDLKSVIMYSVISRITTKDKYDEIKTLYNDLSEN